MMFEKNKLFGGLLVSLILIVFVVNFASAQTNTVCCERTKPPNEASCQNVPAEECADGVQQVPTACSSTSFCRSGTCFDSGEGTCLDNTPRLVCNENGGTWSLDSPAACELGCCILGDQAAFVTLVRCKSLSATLGLETNYDSNIVGEVACIEAVQTQDKGACVFEFEFERSCEFITRAECDTKEITGSNGTVSSGEFFKDKLCSAEQLGTICGPSTKTTCVPGKEEVYFLDTCGNPANVYDASRVDDDNYWEDVISKEDSCGAGSSNTLDSGCGNCNYLQGSICRSEDIVNKNPPYGDFICADLNCKSTSNVNSYRHGESWCVYNDQGTFGKGDNSVGSRFFKHICINGEEVLEQCADFRNEECIEDKIGDVSQAACRVNRWQGCTNQDNKKDCENTDRRDCLWKGGIKFTGLNGSNQDGVCVPKNPPGLKFWEGEETKNICAQSNTVCVVKFEEGIFGGEECVENCECLNANWENERNEVCRALGDCGDAVNWVGKEGNKEGFKVKIT